MGRRCRQHLHHHAGQHAVLGLIRRDDLLQEPLRDGQDGLCVLRRLHRRRRNILHDHGLSGLRPLHHVAGPHHEAAPQGPPRPRALRVHRPAPGQRHRAADGLRDDGPGHHPRVPVPLAEGRVRVHGQRLLLEPLRLRHHPHDRPHGPQRNHHLLWPDADEGRLRSRERRRAVHDDGDAVQRRGPGRDGARVGAAGGHPAHPGGPEGQGQVRRGPGDAAGPRHGPRAGAQGRQPPHAGQLRRERGLRPPGEGRHAPGPVRGLPADRRRERHREELDAPRGRRAVAPRAGRDPRAR
mmetsp:Transcript_20766/g.65185  ORF Transcript_20766/g.65185 Transcript_20766/m.65185 type:complete len:295 (+) Transcript_20766:2705-3589(+)